MGLFQRIQKNKEKSEENIQKWQKEVIDLFEDWCRENQVAVMPELMFRKNAFGGIESIKSFHNFYPLTPEQAKAIFPKFEYKTAEENAEEARKAKEIKI